MFIAASAHSTVGQSPCRRAVCSVNRTLRQAQRPATGPRQRLLGPGLREPILPFSLLLGPTCLLLGPPRTPAPRVHSPTVRCSVNHRVPGVVQRRKPRPFWKWLTTRELSPWPVSGHTHTHSSSPSATCRKPSARLRATTQRQSPQSLPGLLSPGRPDDTLPCALHRMPCCQQRCTGGRSNSAPGSHTVHSEVSQPGRPPGAPWPSQKLGGPCRPHWFTQHLRFPKCSCPVSGTTPHHSQISPFVQDSLEPSSPTSGAFLPPCCCPHCPPCTGNT